MIPMLRLKRERQRNAKIAKPEKKAALSAPPVKKPAASKAKTPA